MANTKDCDWLAEHSLDLAIWYPGKWIAVRDGRVIAVGDTLAEANREAIQKRPEHDFILEQISTDVDMPHVD